MEILREFASDRFRFDAINVTVANSICLLIGNPTALPLISNWNFLDRQSDRQSDLLDVEILLEHTESARSREKHAIPKKSGKQVLHWTITNIRLFGGTICQLSSQQSILVIRGELRLARVPTCSFYYELSNARARATVSGIALFFFFGQGW